HGAGAAALVWRPDWQRGDAAPGAPVRLELDLSALTSTTRPEAPTLTPVTAADAASETLTPAQPAPVSPHVGAELLTPLLSQPPRPQADRLPPSPGPAPPPREAPVPAGAPADPRIAELFDRIRGRLGESCLLALPALLGEDQIQLGVLAADDRRISGL